MLQTIEKIKVCQQFLFELTAVQLACHVLKGQQNRLRSLTCKNSSYFSLNFSALGHRLPFHQVWKKSCFDIAHFITFGNHDLFKRVMPPLCSKNTLQSRVNISVELIARKIAFFSLSWRRFMSFDRVIFRSVKLSRCLDSQIGPWMTFKIVEKATENV